MAAYLNTFYRVLDKLINEFTENGFLQVTYGTDLDLEIHSVENKYPLAHIILPTGSFDSVNTTLTFVITFCDKLDKTGNVYPQYGKNNMVDIQNDLMVKMQSAIVELDQRYLTTYDSVEIGYEVVYPITFDSFVDETPNLLAGYIATLSIIFPNMTKTICD